MSVKGSWTRVTNRDRWDFKKTLIYMETRDLADFLGIRFKSYHESGEELDSPVEKLYRDFAGLAYDVSIMVDPKCEEARKIRRKLMKIHEDLYDIESNPKDSD